MQGHNETYTGGSFFCASFLMTLLAILSSAMSICSPAHCTKLSNRI